MWYVCFFVRLSSWYVNDIVNIFKLYLVFNKWEVEIKDYMKKGV